MAPLPVPASVAKQAEQLKRDGNNYFKKERLGAAIDAYTEVSIQNSIYLKAKNEFVYPCRFFFLLIHFLHSVLFFDSVFVVLEANVGCLIKFLGKITDLSLQNYLFLDQKKKLSLNPSLKFMSWRYCYLIGCIGFSGNYIVPECGDLLDEPSLVLSKAEVCISHRFHFLFFLDLSGLVISMDVGLLYVSSLVVNGKKSKRIVGEHFSWTAIL